MNISNALELIKTKYGAEIVFDNQGHSTNRLIQLSIKDPREILVSYHSFSNDLSPSCSETRFIIPNLSIDADKVLNSFAPLGIKIKKDKILLKNDQLELVFDGLINDAEVLKIIIDQCINL